MMRLSWAVDSDLDSSLDWHNMPAEHGLERHSVEGLGIWLTGYVAEHRQHVIVVSGQVSPALLVRYNSESAEAFVDWHCRSRIA